MHDLMQEESVRWSDDYDMFSFSEENRRINPKHVDFLVRKMEKEGVRPFPIIVNADNCIIDGQHTFLARQRLGESIPYCVSEELQPDDATILNSGRKAWSFEEYLDKYVRKGLKSYIALDEKIKTYKNVHSSVIWSLTMGRQNTHGTAEKAAFQTGDFHYRFDLEKSFHEKLKNLSALIVDQPSWMSFKDFQLAALSLMSCDNFNVFRLAHVLQLSTNQLELKIAKSENSARKLYLKLGQMYNKGIKEGRLEAFEMPL